VAPVVFWIELCGLGIRVSTIITAIGATFAGWTACTVRKRPEELLVLLILALFAGGAVIQVEGHHVITSPVEFIPTYRGCTSTQQSGHAPLLCRQIRPRFSLVSVRLLSYGLAIDVLARHRLGYSSRSSREIRERGHSCAWEG
jgi:hypothetical protein